MRFTVGNKFVSLLAAFLALQVLQLAVGIYQVRHVAEEAELLSGAAKVRPLYLGELARRALAPGGEQAARRQAFLGTLAVHDAVYRRLREEYAHRRADKYYGPLAQAVVEAVETWEKELRPLLPTADPARPEAGAALARHEALAPAQAERVARIVAYLEQDIARETRDTLRAHVLVFVLSMLLAVAAAWLVRRQVTAPLRALAAASRAVAEGSYDRRLAVGSRDELGWLASNFNRMAEAVAERTAQLGALNRIAVTITSSLSLKEVLEQIMRHGIVLTGSQASCIAFYDQETRRFTEWVTEGLSEHFVKNMDFRPGGLADEAFTAAGIYILSNDRPETKHKLSKLAREEGIKSFVCLPLTSHASHLGVIYFYRTDRDTFASAEIDLAGTFASLAAQAIENARLHARTEAMAVTDALTGLHNRRWLDERMAEELRRAQRFGKPLSVLMLDIDYFKRVNDQHGHAAGDAVLKRLGELLTNQLREVDLAARYGGEEFVIIFPETDGSGARQGAERIRRAVAGTAFRLPNGTDIGVTVSIGIACFPHCAGGAGELMVRADEALYVAKQAGRNRVVLYREMLTAELEKNPQRIVDLLNENPGNSVPIVTAIAAKAAFYRGHNELVEQTAMRLADELGLSAADREALRLASELHDIGMAVIPDSVLNKTTRLTPAEWELIKRHPATAAELLEQVPALRHVAAIVRHHHERYDGGGYPDGLRGADTPYLARVLAVADAYGSMIGDWPGHGAATPAAAVAELTAGAGTQLDPEITQALIRLLAPPPEAPVRD